MGLQDPQQASRPAGLEAPSANAKWVPLLAYTELAVPLKGLQRQEFPRPPDEALIQVLDCGVRVSEACDLTVRALTSTTTR